MNKTYEFKYGRGHRLTRLLFVGPEFKKDSGKKYDEVWDRAEELASHHPDLELINVYPAEKIEEFGHKLKMPLNAIIRHDSNCRAQWEDGHRCRHSEQIT